MVQCCEEACDAPCQRSDTVYLCDVWFVCVSRLHNNWEGSVTSHIGEFFWFRIMYPVPVAWEPTHLDTLCFLGYLIPSTQGYIGTRELLSTQIYLWYNMSVIMRYIFHPVFRFVRIICIIFHVRRHHTNFIEGSIESRFLWILELYLTLPTHPMSSDENDTLGTDSVDADTDTVDSNDEEMLPGHS